MVLEVKMNSAVYATLLKGAIEQAIESANQNNQMMERKIQQLKYFTGEEAMEILGYSNKDSLKRKLRRSHIPFRTIGTQVYIAIEDLNKFIDEASKIHFSSLI